MGSVILPVEMETGGEGHMILQCNGCEIRQLQYPPNSPPTLILTILKCWLFCTPTISTTQTAFFFFHRNRDRLSTVHICKQNVQGTNAWLWYMCNRLILIFIHYEFPCTWFYKRKTKSGCQASMCLNLLKIFLSMVLKKCSAEMDV